MMKIISRVLLALLIVVALAALGLVLWASISAQEATGGATVVLQQNGVQREDGLLVFRPDVTTDRGLIYYPGGLVEPEAYAVTAQGIADAGYLVVVPKMALNLAFTGINRADAVREAFPEVSSWVVGGHSLGGAMAAEYARNNVNSIDGLIMYASYPASFEDFEGFGVPILAIVASNDPGAPRQEAFYEAIAASSPASLVVVDGGNHRQYADYRYQRNDGNPTITAGEQQAQIVAATVAFLNSLD